MVLNVILFVVFVILLFVCYWYYRILLCKTGGLVTITGPPMLPIIGNALEFQKPTEVLDTFIKFTNMYGSIFRTVIGFDLTITITDYNILEKIHSNGCFVEKSKFYDYLKPWLGTGLLTARNPKWKRHRKLLTPAFHFKILEEFIHIFHENSTIFIQQFEKHVDEDSVDVYPYVLRFALDTICESAMGTSVNSQLQTNSEYVDCVKDMSRIMQDRIFSPIEQFDILFRFTKNGAQQKRNLKLLHDFTSDVIRKRRIYLEQYNDCDERKKLAFLDMLLMSDVDGRKLTDEEIREEVDTFMFEGHDTISSALSYCLLCLAQNQQAQQKAVDEIRTVLCDGLYKPDIYNLNELKYLSLIIKESLRLYPSVPFYARCLIEDLDLNGNVIKKGTTINIFAYGVHRNPTFFPEPHSFVPERFAVENRNGQFPFSYLPFSAGSRNCIGQKFAMLEMKAVLSQFLLAYRIKEAIPKFVPLLTADAVLKPHNGVCIKLSKRLLN